MPLWPAMSARKMIQLWVSRQTQKFDQLGPILLHFEDFVMKFSILNWFVEPFFLLKNWNRIDTYQILIFQFQLGLRTTRDLRQILGNDVDDEIESVVPAVAAAAETCGLRDRSKSVTGHSFQATMREHHSRNEQVQILSKVMPLSLDQ